ncbi:MAG: response regulator [Legionellaceae bacterium]|nr:response regulator [Legionellaceae bacterium]
MLVLIVEDNAFNAFCLSRILSNSIADCQVRIAANSLEAHELIATESVDWVIMDGDLGAGDGLQCNGPALLDALWLNNPELIAVAWSDSASLRQAFAEVFKRHHKPYNAHFCWPKMVNRSHIIAFYRHCYPYRSTALAVHSELLEH